MATISSSDLYKVIRSQIERETDLIHHRISWLMSAEAFLFAAFAVVSAGLGAQPGSPRPYESSYAALHRVLPILGFLLSLIVLAGIIAAVRVTIRLRKHAHANGAAGGADGFPVMAQGWTLTLVLGLSAPVLGPILICATWAYLFSVGCLN